MRLDKLLSHAGYGSRKDVKILARKGHVTVDGEVERSPERHVVPDGNEVRVDGELVELVRYVYVMLNKPAGVVSSTADADTTVTDLVYGATGIPELFPVGRLDKDATGLIILTNDGVFAHRATSPQKNAAKVYDVTVEGALSDADAAAFLGRVKLDDGYVCREARLEILASGPTSHALVTITEGKYHQVKRMFQALGKRVLTLKRVAFCGVRLPGDLPEGACRPLTAEELSVLEPFVSQRDGY